MADLSGAKLLKGEIVRRRYLPKAYMAEANLSEAILLGMDMPKAYLSESIFVQRQS